MAVLMLMEVSQTAIISAACIGTAVIAGVYVLWGPDNLFRKRGRCPGLMNLGNTCFMNAVLQALATLPRLREWLNKAISKYSCRLGSALDETLRELSEDNDRVQSPYAVLQALIWHCWTIDFQQQDAHELYHVLWTTLSEEMVSCPSLLTDVRSLVEVNMYKGSVAWTRAGTVPAPEKPLVCPLQGLLTSELICCHCSYSLPVKCEQFDSISLTLPVGIVQCTLHSCLLDYVKSEMVHEVECPKCSKVAGRVTKRTFLKRLQLGRPPDCLCIHLKRTLFLPDGSLVKNNTHVSFPVDLDASKLLKREASSLGIKYRLSAVIEHTGGPFSGHYVTYRRCGGSSRKSWVYTSDTKVYRTSISEVTNCKAYMLFYDRIGDTST